MKILLILIIDILVFTLLPLLYIYQWLVLNEAPNMFEFFLLGFALIMHLKPKRGSS